MYQCSRSSPRYSHPFPRDIYQTDYDSFTMNSARRSLATRVLFFAEPGTLLHKASMTEYCWLYGWWFGGVMWARHPHLDGLRSPMAVTTSPDARDSGHRTSYPISSVSKTNYSSPKTPSGANALRCRTGGYCVWHNRTSLKPVKSYC